MNWQTKSAAFRVLSALPLGSEIHYLAQRYLVRSFPRPAARLDALWDKGAHFAEAFAQYGDGTDLSNATFLEVGAGRDLSVPIALRFLGIGRVVSIDVTRLAKLDLVRHSAVHMARRAGVQRLLLHSWKDVESFRVEYHAPATLRSINLPDRSIDCICSNEVLEHVPPAQIEEIAAETCRLLARGGIAIHTVDYSDHYARSDRRIDRFNFLRYSDTEWKRHNSAFQYVNRLRASDYVEIFARNGLRVLAESVTAGISTTTTRAEIAERFRRYHDDDLFALNGRFILGR